MNDSFRFEIAREGATARVALFGEFDMTGVLRLEPELGRMLDQDGVEEVEIDLGGLQFIDSTGLGVVIEVDGRARQGEYELRLLPGPRQVQRVFEVAHLDDTLPFASPPPTETADG